MPNMDYPGPCLSCVSDSCTLWDENSSETRDEKDRKRNSKSKDEK